MTACIETFPPLEWLGRFYEESQMWGDGAIPRWFEDWRDAPARNASRHLILKVAENDGTARGRRWRKSSFSANGGTDCVEVGLDRGLRV